MKQNVKNFLANNRWLKWVPNFLTVCNSLCGFTAILLAINSYTPHSLLDCSALPTVNLGGHNIEVITLSACVIMFAMVFDALDGAAARIFNAVSMHGLQMDSLADMSTFGMAPAVLSAIIAHNYLGQYFDSELSRFWYIVIWAFCALYLACAALRLATYNVHAMEPKKPSENDGKFSGLPSPAAAAGVCAMAILFAWAKGNNHPTLAKYVICAIPVYTAILGLLMVSTFRYTHLFKKIQSVYRKPRELILIIVPVVAMIVESSITCFVPICTLTSVITLYLASAPLMALLRKCKIISNPYIHQHHQTNHEEN